MKKRNLQIIIPYLLLFLCSCSKDYIQISVECDHNINSGSSSTPPSIEGGKYLISFSPHVLSLSPSTQSTPIEEGRYISLFAYQQSELLAEITYFSDRPGSLIPYDSHPMYLAKGLYSFYAAGTNKDENIIPSFTDGKTQHVDNTIDYLYWNSGSLQEINAPRNYNINLCHSCTQFFVKLITEEGISLDALNSAKITVPDTNGIVWNLFTGVITPATLLSTTPIKMGITNNYAQIIMIPLLYRGELTLTFNASINSEDIGRNYEAKLPVTNGELRAGESYLYTIMLNANEVVISTVSVINWVTVVNGNPIIPTPI